MDIIQGILTRRSIRKYTGEPVSEENLKTILQAAFSAPTAHNYQPWHFIIVREKENLEKIATFHPYAKMLPQAGCGVIVCGDKEKQGRTGFLVEDCAAAIQNMLLAAHGIGLGGVWCGLYPVEELTEGVSELINLPEGIIPVGLVVIGHKAEDKEAIDRFDEAKIHRERW